VDFPLPGFPDIQYIGSPEGVRESQNEQSPLSGASRQSSLAFLFPLELDKGVFHWREGPFEFSDESIFSSFNAPWSLSATDEHVFRQEV
jgi:hypothetical protein